MLLLASALLSRPSVLSGFDFPFCLCPWSFSPSSDLVLDPDTCHGLGAALPTLVSPHLLLSLPLLAGDTKGRNYKLRLRQFTGNSEAIRERAVTATMLITIVYKGDGVLQAECSLSVWSPWCDPRDNGVPNGIWTLHAHVFLPRGNPCLLPSQKWELLISASHPWWVWYRITTEAYPHGFRLHPTMVTEKKLTLSRLKTRTTLKPKRVFARLLLS